MIEIDERVDRLEALFGQFMAQTSTSIAHSDVTNARLERNFNRLEQLLVDVKAEGEKGRRELARQLADISNRMGTIVEDIIGPSLRRMAEDELGCGELEFFAIRLDKYRPDGSGQRREFDALYVGKKAILLNETKATPRPEYARDFVEFLRDGEFFAYFPEYVGRPIVPVFSSLYLPDDLITYLTRHGIYAVGMGNEAMEVLNMEQVKHGQTSSV
jgi:hypothetical protein